MDDKFKTREFSILTGLSIRNVKFYNKYKVIENYNSNTKGTGNHKLYDDKAIAVGRLVCELHNAGLTVEAIRKITDEYKRRGLPDEFEYKYNDFLKLTYYKNAMLT